MRCYYHEGYYLPLPEGHPFPMEKFPQAYDWVRPYEEIDVHAPLTLTRRDLERVHLPAYLDAVSYDQKEGDGFVGLTSHQRKRLGLPAHPDLLARSTLEVEGTVSAALAALEDGLAANLAGGTHHARPDRGLGYCVLNDIAIAVAYLRANGYRFPQILIVDTDAHQGDGNHIIFANDPEVFTYSIHVGKNYPAHKIPGDRDVPLQRYASGKEYLGALEDTLPEVFAKTEPDLVFWICGVDCHVDDRFGQLSLTTEDLLCRDALVLGLCRDYCVPVAMLYGGGYQREWGRTGWLHALSILQAAGASLPSMAKSNSATGGTR